MMRPYCCLVMLFFALTLAAHAQNAGASPADYLHWSATRRLTPTDFRLKLPQDGQVRGSTGIFGFGLKGNAYDLLGKRANQAVLNRMLRSGSWLSTTDQALVGQQLQFQQTLFDIQEIYARHLRRQLRAVARKVILFGKPDLDDLISEQVRASEQRQVAYIEETVYGSVAEKQQAWQRQIQQELQDLAAYAVPEE